MENYKIRVDLSSERLDLLNFLLVAFFCAGPVLFGISVYAYPLLPDLTAWVCLSCGVLVATMLSRREQSRLGSWALLIGMVGFVSLVLWRHGPDTGIYMLYLVPIILAVMLLDRDEFSRVALLSIGAMFVLTIAQTTFINALSYTFMPILLATLFTAALYVYASNLQATLDWAIDIKQKDTRRAETFYAQREELALKTRQVTQTLSTLELTNIKLKNAQEKTEQASRAKTTFLSNMSHELRTPLNVVIGYTSTMLEMPGMYNDIPLPDMYRHDIELIKDNGYYLLGLINDILDLSKIEAGKLEIHPTVVDLPDLFRGVISTSIGLVKDKPLQIRQVVSDDLPQIWADPTRVRQIILNLMSNAIKFTQSGSVTLQARSEGNQVYISVTDTGIGIPEKALPHIFDRFEQAARDTEKLYGGTGLGLDISRQLARMHGGELTVQSVLGQGSTFSFNLPVLHGQDAESQSDLLTVNTVTEPLASGTEDLAYTILIVEDEASLRELMRRALESSNHVVVDLQDGEHLIDLAQGLLPDLIILDIRLPNVDGWELLKSLKSNPETTKIPVIISTVSEDEGRGLELGAALYLHKPFSSDELLACVSEILPEPLHTNTED